MPPHDRPEPPAEGIGAHEIGNRTYIVADVAPLDVDGTRTVALGTGLWVVAFVVLLVLRQAGAGAGLDPWLWTCVAGVVLGAIGWTYCAARARRRARRTTGS